MAKIRGRAAAELDAAGDLTPTDQVLLARHLLEASLMGYSLFLALVIDRLHNYIRAIEAKQDIASLNEIKKLKVQLQEKAEEAKNAEAKALAIQEQYEDHLLRYGRLQEEIKRLNDLMQPADRTLSHSDGKKNT